MSKQPRPKSLSGATYEIPTGCGCIYVTCNDQDGRLFEVFAKLGKSGGCGSATMEGLGRSVSIGLRSGVDPFDLVKTFTGIQCHKSPSCIDAVGQAIREHLQAEAGETFVLGTTAVWVRPETQVDKEIGLL